MIVYAPNSTEYLLAGAAARAIGAVAIPMNHRLTADEVAYILDDSDAVLVFVGDPFLAIAETVLSRVTRVRSWVTLGRERRAWATHVDDLIAGGAPER